MILKRLRHRQIVPLTDERKAIAIKWHGFRFPERFGAEFRVFIWLMRYLNARTRSSDLNKTGADGEPIEIPN